MTVRSSSGEVYKSGIGINFSSKQLLPFEQLLTEGTFIGQIVNSSKPLSKQSSHVCTRDSQSHPKHTYQRVHPGHTYYTHTCIHVHARTQTFVCM